jgi:multiple sugar transport system permease protein
VTIGMLRRIFYWSAHYLLLGLYVLFALFPLFWLIKVALTPNDLLYSEGIRLWPSRTSLEHFRFVLTHSEFPLFFRNSLIVSSTTAVTVAAIPCHALVSAASRCSSRLC